MPNSHAVAKLTGKMGKQIEMHVYEEKPDTVEFRIMSNRGTLKDVIEVDVKDVIRQLSFIKTVYTFNHQTKKTKKKFQTETLPNF